MNTKHKSPVLFCIFLGLNIANFALGQTNETAPSTAPAAKAECDDLKVLSGDQSKTAYKCLLDEIARQYDARLTAVEQSLADKHTLEARRDRLKTDYLATLRPFPPKTPLNPQITGTIAGDGYRIDKVVFESRPRMHVTANLYVPGQGTGPWPGILFACGHDPHGKACEAYQKTCILLARNGFVALSIDPLGQEERLQILKPDGTAATAGGTREHTPLDFGAKLVGANFAAYEIWDNIRAIDYLAGLPFVDPQKIGMTGNSGGGTQTTFLMGLDDRIAVAAPSCFITARRKLFETIGPQDGCQNFAGEGLRGVDYADYITMRAPKPTIILAAEKDFFDFAGTKQTYDEAKKIYTLLGEPDNIAMFSYDDGHGFSQPRREAMVRWFRKWFYNDDKPVAEPPSTLQTAQALWASPTGLVLTSWPDELTVGELNLKQADNLAANRALWRWANDGETQRTKIKQLIGCREFDRNATDKTFGRIKRPKYNIEKIVINRPFEPPLPMLAFTPDNWVRGKLPGVLYVDSRGKDVDAGDEGPIAELVRQGNLVISIDARGWGETADKTNENNEKFKNKDYNLSALSNHLGQPLLGQRVDDVLYGLVSLIRADADKSSIRVIGVEQAGPVVLHAAALCATALSSLNPNKDVLENCINKVTLVRSVTSWRTVIANPLTPDQAGLVVPGALQYYDLHDLTRLIAPRTVEIIDPIK